MHPLRLFGPLPEDFTASPQEPSSCALRGVFGASPQEPSSCALPEEKKALHRFACSGFARNYTASPQEPSSCALRGVAGSTRSFASRNKFMRLAGSSREYSELRLKKQVHAPCQKKKKPCTASLVRALPEDFLPLHLKNQVHALCGR